MKTTAKIVAVLGLLVLCSIGLADELLVPSEYPTIQDAIDVANDGDTVLVADGVYTGTGNRDIDFLGKAVTVRSENGPNNCIINCNGTKYDPHRGFYFHNGEDENSILDGFTITNGYAMRGGGWYTAFGGGIFCYRSSPVVTNCMLRGNSSEDDGGGMFNTNASPTITNCTFSGNSASADYYGYYGGALGGGMFNYEASPTITNCVFRGNSAENDGGVDVAISTTENP